MPPTIGHSQRCGRQTARPIPWKACHAPGIAATSTGRRLEQELKPKARVVADYGACNRAGLRADADFARAAPAGQLVSRVAGLGPGLPSQVLHLVEQLTLPAPLASPLAEPATGSPGMPCTSLWPGRPSTT